MKPIIYIDRKTGQKEIEKIYGARVLELLYDRPLLHRWLLPLISKNPLFSALYGWIQKSSMSKKKIAPFIAEYGVDQTEFLDPFSYCSFNDFFIRKLKPESRPIAEGDIAVIPADGRYYFYPNIAAAEGFLVKGEKFSLESLLENGHLAEKYKEASLVIGRLCPSDYHRFHFPCNGVMEESQLINGWLYSVNPVALQRDINIFTKNKRAVTEILSPLFGRVLFIEIGATNVGSIHQTYQPYKWYEKGAEKGYFSFGASSLIMLFPKGSIEFDEDLLAASREGMEIRCLMGQSMGKMGSGPSPFRS
jgi:phosphatidylserine decarboxylase